MAKKTSGLPDSFQISSSKEDLAGPVNLGDFLEEELEGGFKPSAKPIAKTPIDSPKSESSAPSTALAKPQHSPQVQAPPQAQEKAEAHSIQPTVQQPAQQRNPQFPASQPETYPAQPPYSPPAQQSQFVPYENDAPAQRRSKADRVQINLTHEARKAHNAIMNHVRRFSRHPDTKHTEIYQAMLMAIADSLGNLDLSTIPARGGWGSPTARSFVTAHKAAIARAIGLQFMAENGIHPGNPDRS